MSNNYSKTLLQAFNMSKAAPIEVKWIKLRGKSLIFKTYCGWTYEQVMESVQRNGETKVWEGCGDKKNETEEGALYKLKFKKNKFSIYIDIYFYYCDL